MSPEYAEKNVGKGTVIDVNSLYPSVMYDEKIPFAQPIAFEGKYEKDIIYDLYVQKIECAFELKENKIPTIQIKNMGESFAGNEYLKSSYDSISKCLKIVDLVLTNIDLDLFFEHYHVYDITYSGGWKFMSKKGMFSGYIDKWIEVKKKSTIEGNSGMRTLAKLMLNSLYGKLATSLEQVSKVPYLLEDDIVRYRNTDKKKKRGFYIPARYIYNSICQK